MSNFGSEKKKTRSNDRHHALLLRLVVCLLAVNVLQLVSPQPASAWSAPLTSSVNPEAVGRKKSEPCFALRDAAEAGIRVGPATDEAMGQGAFATVDIPRFTKIGTYTGELLTEDQVLKRYKRGKYRDGDGDKAWEKSRRERGQSCTGTYLFNLSDNRGTIDGEDVDVSGWCRYMNHATEGGGGSDMECNVKAFDQLTIGGESTHPTFFAIRDIKAGEELFYDYGSVYGFDSAQEGAEDGTHSSSD
mmetsp:Transcript_6243/g.17873  ORF Transcript_6243/g.17873 Transcript_6243/m.17873 type:complete len:246 (-) Transcript_6243:82-819(-)